MADEKYGTGESPFVFTNIACPINTTRLLWVSHDAVTKTTRYGIGNAVDESHVHTLGHVSTLASYARFLSFYQSLSSSTLLGQAEGWLLTDHAYAAAATAKDNAIAAVLTAWRGVLGL